MHGSRPVRRWCATALAVAFGTSAFADPIPVANGGFESGNTSGWTTPYPNFVSVVDSFVPSNSGPGTPPAWNPVGGNKFALLQAGVAESRLTLLTQQFAAAAGDVLSFSVFFNGGDYLPYNDHGFANLLNLGNYDLDSLYLKTIKEVGDFGSDGWTKISYIIPSSGLYLLLFGVTNIGDNFLPSFLGVDGIELSPRGGGNPVPEPYSLLLWAAVGLGTVVILRRMDLPRR